MPRQARKRSKTGIYQIMVRRINRQTIVKIHQSKITVPHIHILNVDPIVKNSSAIAVISEFVIESAKKIIKEEIVNE